MVGGGPAGALCARQLAVFGLRVVLVHSPPRRRQHLGESLSASAPRLLASYGLELPGSVYAPRPPDHFVRWGGREERLAAQPVGGAGEGQRLVWRDRLDGWALAEARRAGVRVVEGSAAPADEGLSLVVLRSRTAEQRITPRVVVDASGRSGILTRRFREWPGFRTTALTAHLPPGKQAGTLIESFADGWVWSAPVLDGRRDVTVVLDAKDAAGRAEARFREALRSVDLTGFLGGDPLTPIRAADVTPYVLRAPDRGGEARVLAVGDAAGALDPLSGLGTMKAMDAGLTGAVVVRTALERPRDAGIAFSFHAAKERGLAQEVGGRIAAFYAEEHRFAHRPFWRRRARRSPPAETASLPADGRLAPASGVRVEQRGVLEGDWIVAAEVLMRPGHPRAAHRFRDISLPELFRAACAAGTVRRALAASPASEPAARAALGWLLREGFLVLGTDESPRFCRLGGSDDAAARTGQTRAPGEPAEESVPGE